MPFLFFYPYFALISVSFESAFAYPEDLFSPSSASNDIATSSSSLLTLNDQETMLGEGLFSTTEDHSADWNLFANGPDGNVLNDNMLSFCSSDNSDNGQPSKIRARDTSCPADFDPDIIIPKLPDIGEDLKEPDGPNRQFVWLIDVDGVTVGADEPKYYCLPHAPLYSKPVCGSGILSDRWFGHPPLYPQIDKCRLSKSSVCLSAYLSPP